MPEITAVKGRVIYNSRGGKTVEVDITSDGTFLGRACAPSGASVGRHEAASFANNRPEDSLDVLNSNAQKLIGLDASDPAAVHGALQGIDRTDDYSGIGGAVAFAVTIASAESAARASGTQLFEALAPGQKFRFPYPLGNILGGGAHAGPGTPDIQEILVCATGAKTIQDAISTNLAVHKELRNVLEQKDPHFTNGRGDEGGWAPRLGNEQALDLSVTACENLGLTLGRDVSLGVDFASSTQWNGKSGTYEYSRAGIRNTPGEQVEFASRLIRDYKLAYAEDAVHEEAFEEMAEIAARFPKTMVTGDDLTVTNKKILSRAIREKSCNAAILKVNQAGSLYDALEFAEEARRNDISLITSHRSGESNDSHISHIGLATNSKMLKVGVVGGERVAKLNEMMRLSEHDLICGMAEV